MSSSVQKVAVTLPHAPYEVVITAGALAELATYTRPFIPQKRTAVLADRRVLSLYEARIRAGLSAASIETHFTAFSGTEAHKNRDTVEDLYRALFELGFERSDCILAFGGGVVGDLVGFVAATFLRGINFIQIPTTLLAMVDASVGGKVGYNNSYGKNLIGAFHQPRSVVIDPLVLRSLPARDFHSGLAECIKHAVLEGSELFNWTAENLDSILALEPDTVSELIARNVRCKARIVVEDERENERRALLNFGHTFAHAIESACGYGTWLHGEAVALGMMAATHCGVLAGLCDVEVERQLEALLRRANLPIAAPLPATDRLIAAMQTDKKVSAGKLRLVVPREIGRVEIFDSIGAAEISGGWKRIAA